MERVEADVCVVGAGFAGLAAAWRLHQAGLAVVVLEARDRVGGRSFTERLADGTPVDRGCGWIGFGHTRADALAAEMGVGTYPTFCAGDHVLAEGGRVLRYRGTLPLRLNPLQLAGLGLAFARLERLARRVPGAAPWTAARAAAWDRRTLDDWLRSATFPGVAREMLRATLVDLFSSDLSEVSLLGALHLLSSNGGFQRVVSIERGHQERRVTGGTQAILDAVHARLGSAVRLSQPVTGIARRDGDVVLRTPGLTVTARRAVVAVPIWLSDRIAWDPPLPRDRALLIQRVPTGQVYKFHFVYATPWWREQGLSGQSLALGAHLPVTLDACGPDPPPGILFGVCGGPEARALARLDPAARRDTLVGELITRFGPQAGRLEDFVEQDWNAERWTRGGMVTHFPPGVLTAFGPALHAPVGRLHWAGTESAPAFFGTFEGAIRSGERAAQEVASAAV